MTKSEFFEIWHETYNEEWLAEYMEENAAQAEKLSKDKNIGIYDAWNIILEEKIKQFTPDSIST